MEATPIILRMIAGGYFIWSGSVKLGSPGRFWAHVADYRIVSARQSRVVAAVVPPVELLLGLLFAAGFYPFAVGGVLLALLTGFSVAMGVVLIRRQDADCGCGTTGSRVRPALIARNVALGVAVLLGMFSTVQPQVGAPFVAAAAAIVGAIIAIAMYRRIGNGSVEAH